MDGFDGSPKLVRDIQLVGIKEENNPELDLRQTNPDKFLQQEHISPVHSFSKPLEDANKIVTSVHSLFLPGEDSRGVDHCHAFQHWALYDGALEPEQNCGTRKREGWRC